MRDDRERLLDVLEAIEKIERYASRGRKEFDGDELIQTWIVHHMQIIGEACRSLSQAFRESHPEFPWGEIVGMRNVLVHRYFGVDRQVVWSVVQNDLPRLKRGTEAALLELEKGRGTSS
jgi:uncharacterized protein with HEPN domain